LSGNKNERCCLADFNGNRYGTLMELLTQVRDAPAVVASLLRRTLAT